MARAAKVAWMGVAAMGLALAPTSAIAQQGVTRMDEVAVVGQAAQPRPSQVHIALRSGTDCYRRGDYELAATYFQQAQAGQSSLSAEERQDLTNWLSLNNTALQARRQGSGLLRQAEQAIQAGRNQDAVTHLKAVTSNQQFLSAADKQRWQTLSDKVMPGSSSQMVSTTPSDAAALAKARTQLKQARAFMVKGDYNAAHSLALEADRLGAIYTTGEDNPAKVLNDITDARMGKTGGTHVSANVSLDIATPGDPKSMLVAARVAMGKGDYDQAEKLAREADRSSNVWSSMKSMMGGDTPAKVLKDVQVARAWASAKGNATGKSEISMSMKPAGDKAVVENKDPRQLLKQARELQAAGKLDEAEKCAMQASSQSKSVKWSLFEEGPDRVLSDIRSAKTKRDVAESSRVLAEARKMFAQGKLEEAEKLAYKAERLHGPYSYMDMGDRPQKLIAEIEVAKSTNRKTKPTTPAAEVVKKDVPVGLPLPTAPAPIAFEKPAITATAVTDNKPKAQALVAEARKLQREGRLLEARQKAVEAQKLSANFGADEDRPEVVLLAVGALCQKRIESLVLQAGDHMTGGDASRYQLAESELNQAKQLAQGFGFDTYLIDTKLQQIHQTSGKGVTGASQNGGFTLPTNSATTAAPATGGNAHGVQLLEQARMELRAGQTNTARRLAEEAFAPQYGVQIEATQVLKSVDVEEFNQKVLTASRTFDAGSSAYNRKEFGQALTMFRTIDAQLLSPDKQVRLKELMQSPELMAGSVTQAGFSQSTLAGSDVGRAQATDAGKQGSMEIDLAQQVKQMQEVKFQKLRADGLQIKAEAMNRFKAGDTDRALEMLQDHIGAIQDSGLGADKVQLLRRDAEKRLADMKMMKHQRDFEKLQATERQQGIEMKSKEFLAEEAKKKQIQELMKEYTRLFKEGKYKEAEVAASKAHDLDPDHADSAAAIYTARMQANVTSYKDVKRNKENMVLNGLNDAENPGPVVNSNHPLEYNAEMTRNSRLRKVDGPINISTMRTDKEREISRKLDGPITGFDYKDTPLRQILDDLQGWTGINIVADEPALAEAGISLTHPMTIKLEGVALKSALNVLLHQARLTYVVKDEVLNITTEANSQGKLERRVHPVLDLVIPVENFTGATGLPGSSVMKSTDPSNFKINGSTVPWLNQNSLPGGNPVSQNTAPGQANTMTSVQQNGWTKENPTGTMENVLIKLITNTIEPQSWSNLGGKGTIDFYPLGMGLVISQTPDIQEQVAELLSALRRLQDQEVSVEIRFVTIAESFFERIGLDFNINFTTHNTKYEPQLVSQQFAPFGFINTFRPDRFISGMTPAGTLTQDLNIPIKASSFNMAVPPFGQFPNTPGGNGGIDLGLAFLSDIQVFLFMEAAQGDQRTNVMQAPKITLFNGQTSTLTVTDSQFFVTNVSVAQIGGQVIFVPTNTPLPTAGINLTMNAVISADRRYVRMSVTPTITNLASANVTLFPITTFITPVFEGGAVGQPVPFTQYLQQPTFNTVTIATTVNVPDGGTVLLGGLKRLSEGRNEFGPPILSKLPYINRLFKNVGYGREATSLLMMVTPRIIINEEEEQRQVPGITQGVGGNQ